MERIREEKFGKFIRDRRNELGLSLRDIERNFDLSDSYLSLLENGKRVSLPKPDVLRKLSKILDVPYLILLEQTGYLDDEVLNKKGE